MGTALPTLEGTLAGTWLERLWPHIAGRDHAFGRVPEAGAPLARAQALCEALLSEAGELSGTAVSRELLRSTLAFGPDDRAAFLRWLAQGFAPDPAGLRAAAEAYLAGPSVKTAHALALAAEPPRQELLRRMNMALGGTAFLVDLRAQVLRRIRQEPELQPLDDDLRHLLASWFNRGFLELRRIDWTTPAAILERLIRYEAVHEIRGWDDLRRRLAPDRRCFGFFHPSLPDEPLIFVEVALVNGLASAIGPILAPPAVSASATGFDTAIFYSISNCQEGLRGISFGNLLIKQVVEELQAELPGLQQFATLSPVPSLRGFVEAQLAAGGEPFTPDDRAALLAAAPGAGSLREALDVLAADPARAEALRGPISRACARYLTCANDGRGPRDPVARFHLGNGARLERLDWMGNPSERGLRESYGLMVNYLYDLGSLAANHEVYARTGLVARGAEVSELLAAGPGEDGRRSAG